MNRISPLSGLAALVLVASSGLSLAQPAEAQPPAAPEIADDDLPSGWDVLDREVEAMGGAERYLKLKSVVATGTFTLTMMNLEGTITRTQAAPNLSHTVIDLGALGQMQESADGKVAWTIQPGQEAARIYEGEKAESKLAAAEFAAKVRPREQYESAEVLGVENVHGTPCYKVSLVSEIGDEVIAFFEIESGYRVKMMMRASEDSEVFSAIVEMSDFREVDGVTHAFVMEQHGQGNAFVIAFETIVHDAEIDRGIFSPPSEI